MVVGIPGFGLFGQLPCSVFSGFDPQSLGLDSRLAAEQVA